MFGTGRHLHQWGDPGCIFEYGNEMSVQHNWLLHVSTAQAIYHTPSETPLQFWLKTQSIKTCP